MLLSTSSRFAPDPMENIFNFVTNLEKKHKEDKVKEELANLVAERDQLKKRVAMISEQLNSKSNNVPLKSLSAINTETNIGARNFSKKSELNEIMETQKLETYKLTLGVEISHRSSKQITFDFHPNDSGTLSSDVYQVSLSKSETGISLQSAVLPNLQSLEPKEYNFDSHLSNKRSKRIFSSPETKMVIPVQAIADEFLPKVDQFILAFKTHLDAYINRFLQLSIIPDHFSDKEVFEIEYNEDLTRIQFSLTIGEQDKMDSIVMKIRLSYKSHESKPSSTSAVKYKLVGPGKDQFDQEALEQLQSQLGAFCTYPIVTAIRHAF